MKTIRYDNIIFFPLAYDLFCHDLDSIVDYPRDNSCILLQKMMTEFQARSIKDIIERESKNKPEQIAIIDFSNITSVGDRVLHQYFSKINNCIFVNIGNYENVRKRFEEDLGCKIEDEMLCLGRRPKNLKRILCEISDIYHRLDIQILKQMTDVVTSYQIDSTPILDSSGVYSNMYVDTARLFFDTEKHRYIIFRLINTILEKDNLENIDAFVSASRIGANLANIIGWLTGKKVIFCNNIGPKYSLTLQYLLEDIRPKKNYTYVFDVMCLGTEAKLLNAIITVKGATLQSGYGIASFTENQDVLFRNLHALVNIREKEIGYRVTGQKEDLSNILRGEFDDANKYRLSET